MKRLMLALVLVGGILSIAVALLLPQPIRVARSHMQPFPANVELIDELDLPINSGSMEALARYYVIRTRKESLAAAYQTVAEHLQQSGYEEVSNERGATRFVGQYLALLVRPDQFHGEYAADDVARTLKLGESRDVLVLELSPA